MGEGGSSIVILVKRLTDDKIFACKIIKNVDSSIMFSIIDQFLKYSSIDFYSKLV